jgi:hypothetical protein
MSRARLCGLLPDALKGAFQHLECAKQEIVQDAHDARALARKRLVRTQLF